MKRDVRTADTPDELSRMFAKLRSNKCETQDEDRDIFIQMKELIQQEYGGSDGPFAFALPLIHKMGLSDLDYVTLQLESLPIVDIEEEGIERYKPIYFVLCSGQWWPCYNGEENPNNGFLVGGVRFKNGSVDTVAARMGKWAHCNADNRPCMPDRCPDT